MPPTGDLPNPEIEPMALALSGRSFTISTTWEAPLYTDGELNPRDKILGETKGQLYCFARQGEPHWASTLKTMCLNLRELDEGFYNSGSNVGSDQTRRVVCLLILMTFSVPF